MCAVFTAERGRQGYFKDAFHEFLINGNTKAVNPAQKGTKVRPSTSRCTSPQEAK